MTGAELWRMKKILVPAVLALALSLQTKAQTFDVCSDSASMSLLLSGHPTVVQNTEGPFTTIHWNKPSFNSASDYYLASQNTVVTPTSITTQLELALHSSGATSAVASDCLSVSFTVSKPTAVTLEYDETDTLALGFDGLLPSWGIVSDDPDLHGNDYDKPDWSTAVLEPGYTYDFFEQFSGGSYLAPVNENGAFRFDMTLTALSTQAPEPSIIMLFLLGLCGCLFPRCFGRAKHP